MQAVFDCSCLFSPFNTMIHSSPACSRKKSLIVHVCCSWKKVKHDNTATWLAFWNDPISQKDFKYVFLAESSSLRGQSDKEKYEKSRKLKVGKFSLYIWRF